ncbi:MAG: hypothetical protein R6X15_09655 [Pseudomonadota bacterium]
MPANSREMIMAREVIESILDQLHMDAYLFEIEPKDGKWQLKVECAIENGWSDFTLEIAEPIPDSDEKLADLFARCQSALAACKRKR